MIKEWVIGYRDEDDEIRISGLATVYSEESTAHKQMDYLETEWREDLERLAAEEDLMKTNWSTMTLAEKKKERFILMTREVTPYTIIREAKDWE